jgi:opacity protein-like surface antigen
MNRLLRAGAECSALTALSLLLAFTTPSGVRAQGTTPTFNGFAGLSPATGEFGDRNDAGYALGLGVGLRQGLSPLTFRAEGIYNEFAQKTGGGKAHATGLTANAIYEFLTGPTSAFVPYAIGGIGYYSTREPDPFFDIESQSNIGWNLGGGVRFPLSGFSVYAEARYHSVSNAGVQFAPIVFGVTF